MEIFDDDETNLNLSSLEDFPIVFRFCGLNPSMRIFLKNLVVFYQLIYKSKTSAHSHHVLFLDPIENISNELINYWEENKINEGIISTLTSPFGKKEKYCDLFRNLISLRISSTTDCEILDKKLTLLDWHLLNRLEIGLALVKLSNEECVPIIIDEVY